MYVKAAKLQSSTQRKSLLTSAANGNKHATGRHYSPVCKLEWVSREAGRSAGHAESLISCSMDGRITEWFTLKGFDCTDLMLLKRPRLKIPNYAMKKKHAEALIVRHAVGTALCFNDLDPNIYLVGTENGQIHRCSCSYAEQYLNTYNGHTASLMHIVVSSVYAVKYSPFLPDVFLSCSADWTVRLWHSDRQKCYLNMATHSSAVNDLTWSHNHGAVFACTNEGNLEIWDLERSTRKGSQMLSNFVHSFSEPVGRPVSQLVSRTTLSLVWCTQVRKRVNTPDAPSPGENPTEI
ncbi:WD repeat-containing protein 78 [Echinococcus granulosus]|uniref:Dynein axonemal intermediate chain 4 n=1 Tax=Echinococcus granulosus TaxID=6210 RepID=W6UHP4_ECHGR|nr:WD repeat-containing protein 78 [Echinococcus granulosus]EUB60568.1 WD repeat-containing protein 78 [Echinococcus granulosus]